MAGSWDMANQRGLRNGFLSRGAAAGLRSPAGAFSGPGTPAHYVHPNVYSSDSRGLPSFISTDTRDNPTTLVEYAG